MAVVAKSSSYRDIVPGELRVCVPITSVYRCRRPPGAGVSWPQPPGRFDDEWTRHPRQLVKNPLSTATERTTCSSAHQPRAEADSPATDDDTLTIHPGGTERDFRGVRRSRHRLAVRRRTERTNGLEYTERRLVPPADAEVPSATTATASTQGRRPTRLPPVAWSGSFLEWSSVGITADGVRRAW